MIFQLNFHYGKRFIVKISRIKLIFIFHHCICFQYLAGKEDHLKVLITMCSCEEDTLQYIKSWESIVQLEI